MCYTTKWYFFTAILITAAVFVFYLGILWTLTKIMLLQPLCPVVKYTRMSNYTIKKFHNNNKLN